jgi:GMP synthase-like glutamine amidotransferase
MFWSLKESWKMLSCQTLFKCHLHKKEEVEVEVNTQMEDGIIVAGAGAEVEEDEIEDEEDEVEDEEDEVDSVAEVETIMQIFQMT